MLVKSLLLSLHQELSFAVPSLAALRAARRSSSPLPNLNPTPTLSQSSSDPSSSDLKFSSPSTPIYPPSASPPVSHPLLLGSQSQIKLSQLSGSLGVWGPLSSQRNNALGSRLKDSQDLNELGIQAMAQAQSQSRSSEFSSSFESLEKQVI